MSFHYMLYVSDNKVDALWDQLGLASERWRTTRVRLGLTFLEVERSRQPGTGNRFTRLEEVVRFLLEFGDVGDVDEPGQFFGGTLPMRWGPYPTPDSSLLYFGGRTQQTIVGLGGSVRHALDRVPQVPDATGPGGRSLSASVLPSLLDGLASDRPEVHRRAERAIADAESEALQLVRESHDTLSNDPIRYPRQQLEFVAKRLLWGPDSRSGDRPETTILLGSPLYVAVVD